MEACRLYNKLPSLRRDVLVREEPLIAARGDSYPGWRRINASAVMAACLVKGVYYRDYLPNSPALVGQLKKKA